MKTKNVIMPLLAFVVAIGMAFATTPINGFETQVWRENKANPCHPSTCLIRVGDPCELDFLYYEEDECMTPPIDAYKPD